MDLYEYQAKELLDEQDIPTPRAIFAQNSHEVAEAADALGYPCVVKAQVKIGHRGQAGGVKLARTRDEAVLAAEQILPMTIHGHKVHGVLVAEAKNILHEYYVLDLRGPFLPRFRRAGHRQRRHGSGGDRQGSIPKPSSACISPRWRISTSRRRGGWRNAIGFYPRRRGAGRADPAQGCGAASSRTTATLVEINPLAKIGDPDDEASKSLCALGRQDLVGRQCRIPP